jgi:hypothetical protein
VDEQMIRFVVENWLCSHKSPFIKDTDGTSFSEKYYYSVSKSGFKIYVIRRSFKRLAVSHAGYLQIEDQVPSDKSV